MSGVVAGALATPGIWVVVGAALLAGLVRGFSGFGSGLVFMPLAGMVLDPVQAVLVLVVMDLIGPLPNLPGAARTGSPAEIARLGTGLALGLPLGVAVLVLVPVEVFRWGISLMGLVTVALLVAGWRWRGGRGPKVTAAAGFVSGLVGGGTGLPGPPVILYYMASPLPVAAVRANLMMFLVMVDAGLIVILGLSGRLEAVPMVLGLVMLLPFSLADFAGSAMFRPARAAGYRALSYALIAGAALIGLPLFAGG